MLDLVQLRSFLTVSERASFSLAASHLNLSQSTVSQHIRKLETHLGKRLLARDTRDVKLTLAGEALLADARLLLSVAHDVERRFSDVRARTRLRFGVTEDLVGGVLPSVLDAFSRAHPDIDLELTVALSAGLFETLDRGDIDLVFAKRQIGETRGTLVYREPLVWLARDHHRLVDMRPLPLITFPAASVTRSIVLEALEAAGIAWRISCTCASLSGLTAAARAGLGVLVQPRSLMPSGLQLIASETLPALGDVEFVLDARKSADRSAVGALSEEIIRAMKR